MANGGLRRLLAAVGFALGSQAVAPADAQFMSGAYPVVVVPPPPAQGFVMPKRPKPQQPAPLPTASQPPADAPPAPQSVCRPQGRRVVCE